MEGGPPTFRQDFSCPALLKDPQKTLPVRGYHPLWPAFPDRSGCFSQATGLVRVRSPLLTESRLMSFPPATEMFQFAGFASMPYAFRHGFPDKSGWVAPFGNPRIRARLPASLGLSQVPTSFIASQRQDIHRVPLVA